MSHEPKPRIAYIVYNDVYRDSRVLKTADSAARAGAQVRIFAFGGLLSHYPAGLDNRSSGVEILRLSLFPENVPVLSGVIERRRDRRSKAVAKAVAGPAASPVAAQRVGVVERFRKRVDRLLSPLVIKVREADFRRRAVKAIQLWAPDIVHAHDANTLEVAMRVKRRCHTPFVYDAHELWEMRNAVRSKARQRRDRRMLDVATASMAGSVTVSPGIQRWMQERYGLAEAPVLVRNVPPLAAVPPSRAGGRLREMAGLADKDRIIVYVGRITSGRGLPETVRALAKLPSDIHLVVLGYGPDAFRVELTEVIREAGVVSRVHFIGSVESSAVPTTIADADLSIVYTQPINLSYTFSLPNKLFESIHAGQAIVASDLPDVVDLVDSLGVGRTFPSDDIDALATAITGVLAAPEEFRNASRAASRTLTWENEMVGLMSLYERATAGRVVLRVEPEVRLTSAHTGNSSSRTID
ncbi:glycosyltransferase [Microbacterium esteraromaticum]|uniref:glycosyltransferase n=1 Tax=Microbacterium esteraromaticum TaxID=57043 RepID=UPI001A8CD15C|nr:glycosyltransferase [Microbacterium esteraromaticum]MBN8423804.1 glycosyltransferase [Microbacterium esteraromaticum]